MKLIKFIPNLFTLGNLCLGVAGIFLLLTGRVEDLSTISYFIFIAAIFDLLDGLLAKALDARSEIGAQLDSLADLITFGLLPGFIYWHLAQEIQWNYVLFLVPICSAWRLAKFNSSNDQTDSFKGISTTAHGIFVAAMLMLTLNTRSTLDQFLTQPKVLLTMSIFFSLLMVSNMRIISLKMNSLSLIENWHRYVLVLGSIVLALIFGWSATPLIMFQYLILSFLKQHTSKEA